MAALRWRQFYALIWKDYIVHKRHYWWTLFDIVIPVLVCALAIHSNSGLGKPKLENERSFDPDDYERLYGELNPQRHKLLVAPNSSFTRALIDQIDDGAVQVELCDSERDLVELIRREIPVSLDQIKKLLPDDTANVTIGGVVVESDPKFSTLDVTNSSGARTTTTTTTTTKKRNDNREYYEVISKLDGQRMQIPINFDITIRAKDFRLGSEPFPKKSSLGPFTHNDHYTSTFFMASQIMLSRAYINLVAAYVNSNSNSSANHSAEVQVPTNDDIVGQRMPYPKYVAHRRLKESTLGTFVAGAQKQKPFLLTMDYCLAVGFLVTSIFLAKRIVDERKSRVRDMLRLVGISDWTYYSSHASNTMLVMLIQCLLITILFTGHSGAPAQNIDSTLMFAILAIYCASSVMFVLTLSTLFSSSTKAIIFTSLLWLGLPEVLDRIFKLDAGVLESNGFLMVPEQLHLVFALVPNVGLKLMNRLLTECDIYGEFYSKKELYGEYRAMWPNLFNTLPLYKSLTLGHLMLAMLSSIPLYVFLIHLVNSLGDTSSGLAALAESGGGSKGGDNKLGKLLVWLLNFVLGLIVGPFKLVHQLVFGSASSSSSSSADRRPSSQHHNNLSQATAMFPNPANDKGSYLNAAYQPSANQSLGDLTAAGQVEMSGLANNNGGNEIKLTPNNLMDTTSTEPDNNDPRYFEQAPRMLSKGVSIRNLCKTYLTHSSKVKRIEAVRNVSLDMYYSQILVLLGHNGAGKTTLIDIISGHNQKSSGSVHIDGFDIDSQPQEARRRVGFCPQFDVLFERLTVDEHLYFYGLVKGAREELGQEIEELLKQSGLDVHRHKLSKALSGGYKRKLSLAIAMIAKSKVLILDEPTSGMDPESRRKVWDFLQLIRHDRLILMTTHHMEEADAMGDRIAVMSGGQVKCCGSALFLKRVFNAGYHLRISKSSSWNQAAFDELINTKYRLREKLENLTPHELMYKFDADETGQVLPSLFDDLERHKEQVGIFGFGITVSTMDDVFMKIGVHFKDVEAQEMQSKFELANGLRPTNGETTQVDQEYRGATGAAICRKERLEGRELFRQQMRALLAKRYHHARKNWFQLLWILGISLACVASIVCLIDLVIFKEELTPNWSREMTLEGAGYGPNTEAVWQFTQPPAPDEIETLRDAAFPPADTTTTTSSTTTATATITTTRATEIVTEAPTSRATTTGSVPERRRRRTRRQSESRLIESSNSAANDSALFFQRHWLPQAQMAGLEGPNKVLTYTDINTQMIDLLTRQFADFREHYIVGGEKTGKKYVAWYSGEATHAFPISMNIMLNSILKQFTDLIQDQGHPLKGSRISLKHEAMAQINTLIAFLPQLGRLINLVFLPFSLAFITSYFVIFPTHERVTKSKHLQLMTGVPARTFWLSHFLFDLILYGAYTLLVLAIYFIWDRVINDRRIYFANLEHSVALIALVSLFIFGALPLAYIFSFLAKKPTSAFSSFCVLTILTGTATLTLVSLYELKYESTASPAIKLAFTSFFWVARLIPSVSLLVGLQKLFALNTTRSLCINVSPEVLDLLCRYINSPIIDEELKVLKPERCCKSVCQDECYDQWPFFWSGWFGINVELSMLVIDACLYWFILVIIESRSLRNQLGRGLLRPLRAAGLAGDFLRKARSYCWQVPQFGGSDKEQQREQVRIEQIIDSRRTDQYSLVVSDLTKVYAANQFKAVDQLAFVVDKQEFFGLLGVNGAGKSTTFKMLTGELKASSGNAFIGPHDVRAQRRQYLKRIGYCPQQDALIDRLTGAEMLALFARLRGLPERRVQQAVEETLDKLGLRRMGRVNCNNYSGGNKRRLSVGMALIGAPEVIFLDEPTSGVDPRSRRRLWSTLTEFQQQTRSAIVMTSHSMNECECLCDRVAIMVGGQFKVLGSIQYLRTKLSQGFSLVLKLKPDKLHHQHDLTKSSELIHQYVRRTFASSEVELKDLHQTIIQYHIQPSRELTWSRMLQLLERAKQELELEDYQITSDASLESIFLSLAKQQQQDTERK